MKECGNETPCEWCARLDVPASNRVGVDLCDCDDGDCNCYACDADGYVCGCDCVCGNSLDMAVGMMKGR